MRRPGRRNAARSLFILVRYRNEGQSYECPNAKWRHVGLDTFGNISILQYTYTSVHLEPRNSKNFWSFCDTEGTDGVYSSAGEFRKNGRIESHFLKNFERVA